MKKNNLFATNLIYTIFMMVVVSLSLLLPSLIKDTNLLEALTPVLVTLPPTVMFLIFLNRDSKVILFKNKYPTHVKISYKFELGVALIVAPVIQLIALFVNVGLSGVAITNGYGTNISGGLILSVLLLAPIIEEIFFRGVLFETLKNKSPLFRVSLTAFMFALFHMNPFNFIAPLILGFVLGYLRIKTNNIKYSVIAHMFYNVWVLALMHLNVPLVVEIIIYTLSLVSLSYMIYKMVKLRVKKENANFNVLSKGVFEQITIEQTENGLYSSLILLFPIGFFLYKSITTIAML